MQSKILLMSLSDISGRGLFPEGLGLSEQKASSWLSHHHTHSHHEFPRCPYPFPLKSSSTQPLPQGRWARDQGEEGEAKRKQGRGHWPGWLSRGSQEQSMTCGMG